MDLKGAVVVVTGAARGIGKAVAKGFVQRGSRVVIVDVLADELRQTAGELQVTGSVVCDITDPARVAAMAAEVMATCGAADVLVNNAGSFSVIGPIWEADPELWLRDIRVSLYGSFLCVRAFVGGMIARQSGYIINMVSSGGVGDPHPYSTSYACAKTGLMRLTEGLAAEVRAHGVKVFALAPPAVLTEMTRFIMDDPGGRAWRPGFATMFEGGRGAPAELIADCAVRLVGGEADALTGRYILVTANFDELIAQTDDILADDRLTLRIRG